MFIMRITICASLDFSNEIGNIVKQLAEQGHKVIVPKTSEMILNGEVTLGQIMEEKENGEISKRAIKHDVIKRHFLNIKKGDAVLVLNYDKKEIKNYIGPNTFLEIGFAHVLGKKIFLLNEIPNMPHRDEIKIMQPVVINGDLSKIK